MKLFLVVSVFVDAEESPKRPSAFVVSFMDCSRLNDNTSSSCSLIRLRDRLSSFFVPSLSNTDNSEVLPPQFLNLSLITSRELEFNMFSVFASTSRNETDLRLQSEATGFFSTVESLAVAMLPDEWLTKNSPLDGLGVKG